MQIDNPFLTLELRRHRRKRVWEALSFGGAAVALPLLAEAVLQTYPWYGGPVASLPRWLLLGMALCMGGFAGIYAGTRIFHSEKRAGLMESLRLLPLTPVRWLGLKLGFPLLFLLTATGLALPPYLLAVVLGLLPAHVALVEWLAPLLVGAVLVANMLLSSALGDDAPPPTAGAMQALTPKARMEQLRRFSLTLPLQLLLGQAALFTIIGRAGWAIPRPFYGGYAPRWLLLGSLAVVLAAAAVATALAALSASETAERRAGYVRWGAMGVALAVLVGVTWGRGARSLWLLGALALPALAFMVWGNLGLRLKPREDGGAAAELAWLERHWPNPLFLRDLRAHTRHRSLRRSLSFSALVGVVVVLVVGFLAWRGPGVFRGGTAAIPFQFFLQLTIQPIAHLLSRAGALWLRDFQGGRLELLALAPMSTADLVRGRAAAAALYSLASTWGALLAAPAGLIWLACLGFWGVLVPGVVLLAVILVINCAGCGLGSIRVTAPELARPHWWRRFRVGAAQSVTVLVATAAVGLGIYGHWQPVWCWVALGVSLAVLPVALWLARSFFRLRVEELDLLRTGDAVWSGATATARRQ